MRTLLAFLTLLPAWALADEPVRDDVVKKVRALLSASKESERKKMLEELEATPDLDWPSVRKALETGPYYQDPLVTEFGERASGKHLGATFTASDKRERIFHLYVPKSYKADKPAPVLFYLHHDSWNNVFGDTRGSTALARFREACERDGFLFVAPSTNQGCEWWTDDGKEFVRFTLQQLKARFNIDENRIALMGAQDGGSACWLYGQEMPDTFSCLMPMAGSPIDIAESFRPLFLGTLDRMDVLMGVGGQKNGDLALREYLAALQPLFDQRMRLTLAVYPEAAGDVRYLGAVTPLAVRFLLERKRNPLPDEVDIDSDVPLRSLWLENGGPDPEGPKSHQLPSTLFRWTVRPAEKPVPRMGLSLDERPEWPVGIAIGNTEDQASRAGLAPGDVLLAVDGVSVKKVAEVGPIVQKHAWNEYVTVRVAREVAEEDVPDLRKKQERYLRRHAKRLEMEKEGKPVPEDIDDIEDEPEAAGEEDESGEAVIETVGGRDAPAAGGAHARRKTTFFVFERHIRLLRPEGPLVRADFGAGWDREHREAGVKIGNVLTNGPAWRAGFRNGDVILAVGDTKVEKVRDVNAFFESFDWKGFVEFTIRRPLPEGRSEEKTIRMKWEEPVSGRVDVRFDRGDNAFHAEVRDVASFTLYLTDAMVKPGQPFHLFVNDVPYGDLATPADAPDLEGIEGEPHRRKRLERARMPGWKPDPMFAIRDFLARRDRALVFGAKLTIDVKALKAGFDEVERKAKARREERGRKIAEAAGAAGTSAG